MNKNPLLDRVMCIYMTMSKSRDAMCISSYDCTNVPVAKESFSDQHKWKLNISSCFVLQLWTFCAFCEQFLSFLLIYLFILQTWTKRTTLRSTTAKEWRGSWRTSWEDSASDSVVGWVVSNTNGGFCSPQNVTSLGMHMCFLANLHSKFLSESGRSGAFWTVNNVFFARQCCRRLLNSPRIFS